MDNKLKSYLKKHNIEYTEHKHPAVFTVEESRLIKQKIPGMHTKCLFLKDNNCKFYLVALPADKRLNTNSLKKLFSIKKLHFASKDELKSQLNLTPGSVSIFGMIYSSSVNLIIDKCLYNAEITGFHPNINTSTLEITHKNLIKFLNTLKTNAQIIEL